MDPNSDGDRSCAGRGRWVCGGSWPSRVRCKATGDGQTNRVLYRIARNEVNVSNTNEINTVSDIKKNEDCWAYRIMIDELGAMLPKLISNT